MYLLNVLMFYSFFLVLYGLIIYGVTRFLRNVGVNPRIAVFAAFAVFGMGSGLLAALAGRSEGWYIFNAPGVFLADEISNALFESRRFDQSVIAFYDVPWLLRTPQVTYFTSSIVWIALGIPAQLIHNLKHRKAAIDGGTSKQWRAPVVLLALTTIFAVSGGLIFLLQSDRDRFGPSEPWAVNVAVGGLPSPNHAPVRDPPRDTWTMGSLDIEPVAIVGHHVEISGSVVNLSETAGIIDIEIQVNGKILETNTITILPGENQQRMLFMVIFPKTGIYTVTVANLSQQVEVVPSEK